MSNPAALIRWTDNEGRYVGNPFTVGYDIINDESGIWLKSPTTLSNYGGVWTCTIEVVAMNVTIAFNRIRPTLLIGLEAQYINVTIIGKPNNCM